MLLYIQPVCPWENPPEDKTMCAESLVLSWFYSLIIQPHFIFTVEFQVPSSVLVQPLIANKKIFGWWLKTT